MRLCDKCKGKKQRGDDEFTADMRKRAVYRVSVTTKHDSGDPTEYDLCQDCYFKLFDVNPGLGGRLDE